MLQFYFELCKLDSSYLTNDIDIVELILELIAHILLFYLFFFFSFYIACKH